MKRTRPKFLKHIVSQTITRNLANTGGIATDLQWFGPATLTLNGANTYTGTTTINAGTMVRKSTTASTAHVISSGAVLEINVASGTRNEPTNTMSGTGTLRKTGAGTLQWTSTAGTFSFSAGALIDVQAGQFTGGSFANENWTANQSDLNVASGATFDGVEANIRVNAITGLGTIKSGYPGAGYANFTFGVNNGSGTFAGVLADQVVAGNYMKIGTGTQTLSGTNTNTGTTTVNVGTLAVSGSSTSSPHTVASAATISGGSAITGSIGALTFSALASKLSVNAITASSASKLTCTTLTAASGFTINVGAITTVGVYDILVSTSGTPTPTLGTNATTITVIFAWVGQILKMTLV